MKAGKATVQGEHRANKHHWVSVTDHVQWFRILFKSLRNDLLPEATWLPTTNMVVWFTNQKDDFDDNKRLYLPSSLSVHNYLHINCTNSYLINSRCSVKVVFARYSEVLPTSLTVFARYSEVLPTSLTWLEVLLRPLTLLFFLMALLQSPTRGLTGRNRSLFPRIIWAVGFSTCGPQPLSYMLPKTIRKHRHLHSDSWQWQNHSCEVANPIISWLRSPQHQELC